MTDPAQAGDDFLTPQTRKEVIPLNETAAHPMARIRADRTNLAGRFDMPLDGHRTGRYQTRRKG